MYIVITQYLFHFVKVKDNQTRKQDFSKETNKKTKFQQPWTMINSEVSQHLQY